MSRDPSLFSSPGVGWGQNLWTCAKPRSLSQGQCEHSSKESFSLLNHRQPPLFGVPVRCYSFLPEALRAHLSLLPAHPKPWLGNTKACLSPGLGEGAGYSSTPALVSTGNSVVGWLTGQHQKRCVGQENSAQGLAIQSQVALQAHPGTCQSPFRSGPVWHCHILFSVPLNLTRLGLTSLLLGL